jgi:hypothetical protein
MRDQQEDCGADQDMSLTGRIGRVERFLTHDLGFELGVERYGVVPKRRVTTDKLEAHIERAGKQQKQEQTAFEEIINRIQGSTDRVCMIADRLEKIGHRVFGPLKRRCGSGRGRGEKEPGRYARSYLLGAQLARPGAFSPPKCSNTVGAGLTDGRSQTHLCIAGRAQGGGARQRANPGYSP